MELSCLLPGNWAICYLRMGRPSIFDMTPFDSEISTYKVDPLLLLPVYPSLRHNIPLKAERATSSHQLHPHLFRIRNTAADTSNTSISPCPPFPPFQNNQRPLLPELIPTPPIPNQYPSPFFRNETRSFTALPLHLLTLICRAMLC